MNQNSVEHHKHSPKTCTEIDQRSEKIRYEVS